ncbi:dicarboxylate/amino acid:cation symporter [Longimicrobium terrae]|uniref:DAACS family dicarboxylate/amino acid:cation (Na+ or H+) symporter n=1 Tax=Longimicrobium terrae TaxID=1639882 RepID=A0A841GWZ6_9BACT|nr:dicarboxylate/amino acid:cation symporter [Longimicrobium terrae]MBB4635591.1 DAACS family dicarboxylate/amino acid:cation (Na+ or H+) symporter [Longimicrobium terrae]MBB6069985.1 DAACS family dicarboxylate/amino acid:cation (Na+ or H+) symporter [Longimicrobium terrae]
MESETPAGDGFERELTTDLDDRTPDPPRGMAMHNRILLGLVLGAACGLAANAALGADDPRLAWTVQNLASPVGALFLRLLLMVVIPLVFAALVVGVAGIGDVRKLGRVGLKSFGYTLVVSAISVVVGLTLANTIRPGDRMSAATATALEARYGTQAEDRVKAAIGGEAEKRPVLTQVIETVIPSNPFAAASSETPNLLHLMFFALALGVAATLVGPKVAAPFVNAMESLFAISAKLIEIIMKLAPFAVFALLFASTAGFGLDLLGTLAWFVLTVLLGLGIQMFGVYSLSVALLSRISPIEFFRRIQSVMLTAFSTSSSNATLPTALRVTEQNLGVPKEINSFVLTVGATANQNGTALYEGVTVLFLAQIAGVDLSIAQQITVAYLAILGGIGTAGVPSGSIPFIIVVLATIGVNPALIGIILGVDRILDMCRTTLNVAGDITAATYVARSEGYKLLGRPGERIAA